MRLAAMNQKERTISQYMRENKDEEARAEQQNPAFLKYANVRIMRVGT